MTKINAHIRKLWHTALPLLVCACILTGCADLHPVEDYSKRIANVLDAPFERGEPLRHPLPAPKHLAITLTPADISALDFFKTTSCNLYKSIAKRNDILGKVASPSQQLFIDVSMLRDIPPCITQLEDTTLIEQLNQIYQKKEQELPAKLWAALLGSQENRGFWSSNGWSNAYPEQAPADLSASLSALSSFSERLLSKDYQFTQNDYNRIEDHLNVLRKGDGGLLLTSMMLLNQQLEGANKSIQSRLERPLCLNHSATTEAGYFQNVVTKFFAGIVQRWAVTLHQRHDALIPQYTALENQLLPHAPLTYQRWVTQRNSLFGFSLAATKKHALNIQKLYKQCNLKAGA